jgi:hypothetical protein
VAAAVLATAVFWIPGEGSLLYPYTPAVSIGFIFVLAAMGVAVHAGASGSGSLPAAAAGLLAGLAYLTKQEMGAAAALGVAAAWMIACPWRSLFTRGSIASGVFLATVFTGYGIALGELNVWKAARSHGLWPFAPIPPAWRAQYAGVTGVDRPMESAWAVLSAAGAVVAAVAGAAAVSAILRGRHRMSWPMLVGLALGSGTALLAGRFHRIAFWAIVPVAVLGALIHGFRRRAPEPVRAATLAAMSASALPLLTRVGWRGWSDGPFTAIGYSLALPVTVFAISRLFLWFRGPGPAPTDDIGTRGSFAVVSLTMLLALPALFRIGRWPEPVIRASTPRGVVFVSPSWAKTFGKVHDYVIASTSPGDEVLFLPQSHGLNFLLDRDSPVPGLKLDPAIDELGAGGLIGALAKRPPLLVVVFDENSQIYDSGGYGSRYGRELDSWIQSRYRLVDESEKSGIGFRIMKLADRATSSGGSS